MVRTVFSCDLFVGYSDTNTRIIAGGLEVLNWLIAITSASFFTNWAIIGFTSFRFRAAVKAQRSAILHEHYGWKSSFWPLAPCLVLVISTLLLICILYLSIKPLVCGPRMPKVPKVPIKLATLSILQSNKIEFHRLAVTSRFTTSFLTPSACF